MKNTLSDRLLSAFIASLAAVLTAAVIWIAGGGEISILWLGYFVGLMAVVGFLLPEKSPEVFGFLWGTSTALSDRAKAVIISLVTGAILLYIYIHFLN